MDVLVRRGCGMAGAARRSLAWVWQGRSGLRSQQLGQGLVEYALILLLIVAVVVGALTQLGKSTSAVISKVDCSLGTVSVSSAHPGNPSGGGGGIGNNTTTTTTC